MDKAKKNSEFNLSTQEMEKAVKFNKLVVQEFAKVDPSGKRKEYYTDFENTTRFLIARDYKENKALEMWNKWYEWRQTYKADEIKQQEIANELKAGKAYWHGYDKQGHPCLILQVRRHVPKQIPKEETLRYGVYLIEEGIKKMDEKGVSKMVVIWDRVGFTKKNYDSGMIGMVKELIGILQDFYAERLGKLYVLNANWFFKAVFAIIKPFLAEKSKQKIKILGKTEELLDYFDKSQLLLEHGGTSKFVYANPIDGKKVVDEFTYGQGKEPPQEEEPKDFKLEEDSNFSADVEEEEGFYD